MSPAEDRRTRLAGVDRARIARRLGGPTARRRRHRRFALAGILLAAVAGTLILVGGDDDDGAAGGDGGTTEAAAAPAPATVEEACLANNREIGTAQRALLRDNETPEAIVGFLGDAFVDLTRQRAADIRAVDPGDEVLAIVDAHDAVVDAIEADPQSAAGMNNPFDEINERWRAAGLDECVIDASTVQ